MLHCGERGQVEVRQGTHIEVLGVNTWKMLVVRPRSRWGYFKDET